MREPAALAAFLLLAPLLSGCSGGDDGGRAPLPPEWRGRDLREPGWANETLPSGWTVALEYDWSAGKRVTWDFVVLAPVFNRDPVRTAFVHFQLLRMDGGTPRPLVAQDADQGEGERTIVQSGVHQVDWMNEYSGPEPVVLAYKVPDGARVIRYPPGEGPGCLATTGRSSDPACLGWPSGLPPPPATRA